MLLTFHVLIQLALIARALLRPHRDPASRIAWITVILALPIVGIVAYLLVGETSIGRRRVARVERVTASLPPPRQLPEPEIPENYASLFQVGRAISGFPPAPGNHAWLMKDSDAAINAMVADIDAATDHVHVLFYIWLPDNNGCKMAEALKRAVARGVTCRAMVDDLGSRRMTRSPHWAAMRQAGVKLARALPIGNPLLRLFYGRIDLRNHRKIVVIDNAITYCGSQNCADPEFTIKAKYAPWVDAVMRFEGPVARQNQRVFASDWMARVNEELHDLLRAPVPEPSGGFTAQVVASGPTLRYSAMPEMIETLMYSARRELIITTPYFVPDESMQAALCACAHRGISTTVVLPARNDSWYVAAASRSYYADLLAAGVQIYEFVGGLLHAKTLTLDGAVTLIGSANMDRRSFDLNYENSILLLDEGKTAEMRARQQSYIAHSRAVTRAEVDAWRWPRRLVNNAVAMLGPVL